MESSSTWFRKLSRGLTGVLLLLLLCGVLLSTSAAQAHEGHHSTGRTAAVAASEAGEVDSSPVPRAKCGPGSNPETDIQGRVSAADHASGRAAQGYTCNTELVGRFGATGGYKVHRYTDSGGRECGYYDTTLLFPGNIVPGGTNLAGTYALDMSKPANPVKTKNLVTPAVLTPHESLSISHKRGLLGAVMGNPTTYPGFIDIYDISQDCRDPALRSSLPLGVLGHEANFAPDGKTFYSSSTSTTVMSAVDVSNPSVPVHLWSSTELRIHGMNVSDDGNRLYLANLGNPGTAGLTILDVSQIQKRLANPQTKVVSHLTWGNVSIPQNAIPVTINDHPYVLEFDEFARDVTGSYDPRSPVGAARIIDVSDETKPKIVSNIRLEVNTPENRAGDQANDPAARSGLQGYAAHYCAVPRRDEPEIAACSFILSGLRVFDIRDPSSPKEIAYFNPPPKASTTVGTPSNYAMSAPAFVPERGEIWYSDGNSGFYAVRVTNGIWAAKPAEVLGTRQRAEEIAATGLPLTAIRAAGLLLMVAALWLAQLVRTAR